MYDRVATVLKSNSDVRKWCWLKSVLEVTQVNGRVRHIDIRNKGQRKAEKQKRKWIGKKNQELNPDVPAQEVNLFHSA